MQFGELITGYEALRARLAQGRLSAFKDLIKDFEPVVAQISEQRRRSASRFNFFDALALNFKETSHSRFLAFLLNPFEKHDQGTVFLREFLNELQLPDIPESDLRSAVVRTEQVIDEYGRTDISIRFKYHLIVVENKVWAGEGDRQLERYRQWLSLRPEKHKILTFLTPDGHRPVSGHVDLVLSYGQLASLLKRALSNLDRESLPLTEPLKQYIRVCDSLQGDFL